MPRTPSKAHGFAMRSMSFRDLQISKSEKNNLSPPPRSFSCNKSNTQHNVTYCKRLIYCIVNITENIFDLSKNIKLGTLLLKVLCP